MRRIAFLSIALCALCVPLAATASGDEAEAQYVQTLADFGIQASGPGLGADVAVGHGYAVACPPGRIPPFPSFCNLTPREFRFAGASSLAAGVAAGVLFENATFCSAPGVCTTGPLRARVICVTVTGNRAVIGARVEQTVHPITHPEGSEFLVSAIDNGRAGDPVPDLFSPNYRVPVLEGEGQCLNDIVFTYMVVVEGEVIIRDGQVSVA